MNNEEIVLLKQTYDGRHGAPPDNDYDTIRKIHGIYVSVMGVERMTTEEKDGLANYYKNLKQRGAPAYYWILDAIYITSRKSEIKRKFEYLIGILKKWRTHGYGYTPSSEETEIVDYFEEVVGEPLPDSHRHLISDLMTSFGAVAVTRLIGSLQHHSKSYAYLTLLKDLLQDRYATKGFNLPELPLGNVQATEKLEKAPPVPVQAPVHKTKEKKPADRLRRPAPTKEDYILYGELLITFLQMKKEAKPLEMFDFLVENGLEYDRNNRDRLIKKISEICPVIKKVGYGIYALDTKLLKKREKEKLA